MKWIRLEPIKGGRGGCPCCGYQHDILPEESIIGVGFGDASLTKNGEVIFQEVNRMNFKDIMTCKQAEELAIKDPDNDWRIHLVAQLSERHYQRQGEKHWVLYEKGMGFA